jgi:hypothetical protein
MKMAQNNGDFTVKQCRAVMKYVFLKGNLAKNIYDMLVTLGDKRPSNSTVKKWVARFRIGLFFLNFPLYLQSVPIPSSNVVKSCKRVLSSTHLYLIGSESSCDLGSETYKLNLKH